MDDGKKKCESCRKILDIAEFPYRKYTHDKMSELCTECNEMKRRKWNSKRKFLRGMMRLTGNSSWASHVGIYQLFKKNQIELKNLWKVLLYEKLPISKRKCPICGDFRKLFRIRLDWGKTNDRSAYPFGCYICWKVFCRIAHHNRGGWDHPLHNIVLTLSDGSTIDGEKVVKLLKKREVRKYSPRYLLGLIKRRRLE